jgi:sugar phosphate isomerase/epimerase
MNLAVSNIAWNRFGIDQKIARTDLLKADISFVELAPALTWSDPASITSKENLALRNFWNSLGIEICALQSLLYGREDLQLFGDSKSRSNLLDYVLHLAEAASEIGATTLVFGSPLNRNKGELSKLEADLVAIDFFQALDQKIYGLGISIAIEPNPTVYKCDYLTSVTQVLDFLKILNCSNIKLNFDLACTILSGEDPIQLLPKAIDFISHIHISEPNLGPIELKTLPHVEFARTIKLNSTKLTSVKISMEMRDASVDGYKSARSIEVFKGIYLG